MNKIKEKQTMFYFLLKIWILRDIILTAAPQPPPLSHFLQQVCKREIFTDPFVPAHKNASHSLWTF